MNRLAMVCAVALAVAFAAEGKEPKRYLAPDGVNEIIDYGNGVKAQTLVHVVDPAECDGITNGEVLTNDCACPRPCPCKVKGRNVITKKVRSPLGKEIDATKGMVGNLMLYTKEAFEEQHAMLTNAISRLEALERKEAEREKARSDAEARRKASAEKRKARDESDKRKVMQDAVNRSKRLGSRNGRKGIITKEDVNKAASEGGAK